MFGTKENYPQIELLRLVVQEKAGRLSEAQGDIPDDSDARYRSTGLPRLLALAGVLVGFVFLVVPGVVGLRSYRRWQQGEASTPHAAWTVLALGLGVGVGLALWRVSPLLGAVAGLIAAAIGLSLASP